MCENKTKKCSKCKRELPSNSDYFNKDKNRKDGLYPQCKECRTGKKLFTKEGFKICTGCHEELNMNTDYFFKNKDTKDGFTNRCKVCQGYEYTDKLTKIPKEGFKFRIKCDRELESNIRFFPPDKQCKNGLRNVCRECGKDGHFMDEDYIPKTWWSEEANRKFIELYPHYTNKELIEIHYADETEKSLSDKAYLLGVVKSNETTERRYKIHSENMSGVDSPLYGLIRSEETRKKLSESRKGKYVGEKSYWYGKKRSLDQRLHMSKIVTKRGYWKGENNPRYIDPLNGERNGNWQGGITPLNAKIRNSQEYLDWKISVFKKDNYTCQCCGSKNKLEAHHIENFSEHEDKRFDVNNGLTMCTYCHNPIHQGSFHHTYGTKNNNMEQIHEFFTSISWTINVKRRVNNEDFNMQKQIVYV
ncbi:NUMOD3 domain-containing DNA-binding protein [Metabacillus fastidiosus]|uniref:NUMOD3 domain-containing DNA-binding protein n=1 Tax=Metabacillus fastidiosus TaxID=1458 RepID=UPI003D2D34AE